MCPGLTVSRKDSDQIKKKILSCARNFIDYIVLPLPCLNWLCCLCEFRETIIFFYSANIERCIRFSDLMNSRFYKIIKMRFSGKKIHILITYNMKKKRNFLLVKIGLGRIFTTFSFLCFDASLLPFLATIICIVFMKHI